MSTEHPLLKGRGMELLLDENGSLFDLRLHDEMREIGPIRLARQLTSEQLEQLAVRLLYVASYHTDDERFLSKYNLNGIGMHGKNKPLEL